MRAALYGRVSSKLQKEEGHGLEIQIERMMQFASEHGYDVPGEYIFRDDIPGEYEHRPQLTKVLMLCEQGQLDAVIVDHWDRLARDTDLLGYFKTVIQRHHGVKVLCASESAPEDQSIGAKAQRGVMGVVAQIENEMRRERSIRGVKEAAITKGQLPGGGVDLYGYDYHPRSKTSAGRRTINEEEARILRLMFKWLIDEKISVYSIARRLEEMGIPTKRGLRRWRRATVYRMLTYPGYCGKTYAYRWHNVEPEKPRTPQRKRKRSSTRLRESEDWLELGENLTPAIVSEEVWEAAQKELQAKRRPTRHRRKYPYLLRGMVRCHCGKSMVANTVFATWRYYRCSGRNGHHFSIPADLLEETVWHGVREMLTMNPSMILNQLQRDKEGGQAVLEERIEEVRKAIADLQLAESRAISLFSFGKMDQRKVQDQVERIRTEMVAWESELKELEGRLRAKAELEAAKEGITEIMGTVASELNDPSFERKREILEAIDLRVYMCSGHVDDLLTRPDGGLPAENVPAFKAPATFLSKMGNRPLIVLFDLVGLCQLFPAPLL